MPSMAPTLAPGIRKLQFTSMDVHEAGALLHLVFSHRSPSCPHGSRFLFPCNKMIHGTFTLCAGNRSSLMKAATMSVVRGLSRNKVEGLCEVVWTIEANLAEGQLLYITGDPVALGGWDPHMAVLMSATEDVNIWMARVKIAYGGNIKYNYFIKEGAQHSGDIIWRPGPQYSLSIPLNREKEQKVLVRDLWMKSKMDSWQRHTWSSWIDELACTSRRDDDIKKYVNKDLKESNKCMENCKAKDGMNYNEVSASVDDNSSNSRSVFSERNQPIEEPWLQLTSLFSIGPRDTTKDVAAKENDNSRDEELEKINNQDNKLNKRVLPEESASPILEDSFSTVILINSSICTMQRIAVLEDGNLVELLLEPVKTHVQCDSVYLGVVTKLVPHMGGAFVNIGGTRHSLMDIKSNREPFIFPPFRQKKQYVNDYVSAVSKEHLAGVENGVISFKVAPLEEAAVDNSQESLDHDDYDESDDEEDCDVPEVHKSSMNGSMIGYGDAEVDFEDLADGERHLVDETADTSAYFGRNGSSHSPASCTQDAKEIEGRVNDENRWDLVTKGTKIIVQVVKEGLGTKGPTLTAYPRLRSRFWILLIQCDRIGVSKKITGVERTRLKVIAKTLQPQGFGITVRTVAAGHSLEELQKDLTGLLSTWRTIAEHAKSAALAADEGIEGAVPVILHRAMGQTLSIVQDYFNEKAKRMVVDSPRTYHEVTNYLQEIAPDLCDRVELFEKQIPLFDEFKIEEEINRISSKRVPLPNGGSLVIEQTEALVSIDVNGGHVMFGHGTSQEKAILDVNLAAAKQIARELRLRDIGGIIVVDFIDMADESDKRLVYEEVKKAVERDRSMVKVSELSRHGLMEITRKRVRPSVTFMISEPCSCCHATGRVEALETSFSKIEQEICRSHATMNRKSDPGNPKSWPRFVLRVDHHMCTYLTSGKKTRIAILSSSLKVWILLKVARGFSRGEFEVKPFTDEKAEKNKHQVAISMLRTAETGAHSSGSTKLKLVPVKKAKASKK